MDNASALNSFNKLFKNREMMRQNSEREQLKLIADNQRAVVLVRLFEEGRLHEVQQLAAVG